MALNMNLTELERSKKSLFLGYVISGNSAGLIILAGGLKSVNNSDYHIYLPMMWIFAIGIMMAVSSLYLERLYIRDLREHFTSLEMSADPESNHLLEDGQIETSIARYKSNSSLAFGLEIASASLFGISVLYGLLLFTFRPISEFIGNIARGFI
jgi:ABC-type polysaccharide/polyol phosphate export permease